MRAFTFALTLVLFVAACSAIHQGDGNNPDAESTQTTTWSGTMGAPTAVTATPLKSGDDTYKPASTDVSVTESLPTCPPVQLPDLGSTEPTTGSFGHALPAILGPGSIQVTPDQLKAKGFDFQVFTAAYPLVAIVSNLPMDSAYEYFAPARLDDNTTLNDVVSEGGVMVSQQVTYGHDAEKVKNQLGDKAYLVDFGPYDAALSLGSSLADGGPRPYDVYWSDGTYDYSVIAGTKTAAEAIAVARSNICS